MPWCTGYRMRVSLSPWIGYTSAVFDASRTMLMKARIVFRDMSSDIQHAQAHPIRQASVMGNAAPASAATT